MAAESVSLVPSQKGGSLLNIDGFLFSKNKRRGERCYWRCNEMKTGSCRSWAITVEFAHSREVIAHTEHNHPARAERTDVARARENIRERARNTMETPAQIIQHVTAEMPSTSTVYMPNSAALRQSVKRVRLADMPAQPTSIDEVNVPENLKEIDGEQFLGKDCTFDSERILLFATRDNLQKLQEASYWVMDGIFKTCPTLFHQIYTIHAMVGTDEDTRRFVPLVYGLLSSKSQECYENFLEELQKYAMEFDIKLAPKYILTDFQIAAINATKRKFGNCRHKCCLFHLGQSIYRAIQAAGLSQLYGLDTGFALLMRHLQALAFLPANEIPAAFEELKRHLPDKAEAVVKYFEENFVLGKCCERTRRQSKRTAPLFPPSIWSVHENNSLGIPRTSNKLEGWHRRWNSIFGEKNLGVYNLITYFIQEQNTTKAQIEKVTANTRRTPPRREQKARETALQTCISQRETVDLMAFLKGIAYHL
ncbi:FLYWCH-type zinc finger-containing protein 1 [Mixophyes fleayi]|uniref:FLYWCH-type zinc finger-containing protein 1 n=1 Tax=Mixophyes fleayi TaxID=3061075 RepID=UPI003F4DB6A3